MDKYIITAMITAKAGSEATLEAEIRKNIPNVRQEKGCERYDFHVIKGQGSSFLFYEIWADKTAFEAHGVAPHMVAYKERIKDLVACPTKIDMWSEVDVVR